MRRIAGALLATLCLALPSAAGAAITPNRDAGQVATSLAAPSAGVTGASFPQIAPLGDPVGVSDAGLAEFPIEGASFAVISSGDAKKADPATPSGGANNGGVGNPGRDNAFDITNLRIDLNVPAGANCLTLGFRFFTDEGIGAPFNDGFIAELDVNDWSINASDNSIVAPHNFAFDPAGNVLSVRSPGETSLTPEGALGTGYSAGTPRLNAAQAVTPGAHSLYLSIFDQGDEIVDSAAFLDRLALLNTAAGGCVAGALADETAPTIGLATPANGSTTTDNTPTLGGPAGTAAGDSSTVTVRLFSGAGLVGLPLQTHTPTASNGAWAVDAGPLPLGQYTARAEQSDATGNVGFSAASTFTVAAPQVVVPQAPTPVLGQMLVASRVSGTVRIKGRNGRFRTLGANEAIPVGSEVDATKGRVKITAAVDRKGTVQSSDFYKGAFKVTQDRKVGGTTHITLSGGKSQSCPSAKKRRGGRRATASARKKVRRLFGDGKGKFETRGRHGAATVRGTKWLTQDRCDGTYVRVQRGAVTVRDFARRKTVTVRQGKSYLAKSP